MNARTLAVLFLGLVGTARAQAPALQHLQEVPFPQVRIADSFFAPRRATNTQTTLRHALQQLEDTGTLGNFDLAAKGLRTGFKGYVFQDSDAYKALEAVAYSLAEYPDAELARRCDAVIERIAKAQQPDGYLNTWYIVNAPDKRFVNLRDDHELYCAGHLFEAAAAHFTATGKRNLLAVATKYADLLVKTFGPGDDQRQGYCGHPEVELALVKLARVTGRRPYLDLAAWFVKQRGSKFFATEHGDKLESYDGTYWLDHVKIADLQTIAGHAVRAAYLLAGATDIAALTDDETLLKMSRRVWRNAIGKNVFVTGGIGPSASNEGFTRDYDLPTYSAYQESCASIAVAMWARRLALLTGDSQYADAVETALYNAIPAGVQLDGTRFFYVNPLASRGAHHRREWFGCACCPPNLARTFASLGSYACATGPDSLWIDLYLQGTVEAEVGKEKFALAIVTDYPWDGEIELKVTKAPTAETSLQLRIPGWCTDAKVTCNGESMFTGKGGMSAHVGIRRVWKADDVVHLSLAMPVRTIEADPRADSIRGRVAFARGPIVYCLEQADHKIDVDRLVAPPGTTLVPERRDDLLGGVTVLTGELLDGGDRNWPARSLYVSQPPPVRSKAVLVPYAVWDNRQPGPMSVWLPQAPPPPRLGGPERTAKIEISFQNANCDPEGLRDGEEPQRSSDAPVRNCHWWNHLGGTEWVQYVWEQPQRLSGCRIFWFDDTGHGACRLPKSARLLYRDGEQWKPVQLVGTLPIAVDRWCDVQFAPVATTALRLEVEQQPDWASGVLEWRIEAADEDR